MEIGDKSRGILTLTVEERRIFVSTEIAIIRDVILSYAIES
jgi:hypothetical protein